MALDNVPKAKLDPEQPKTAPSSNCRGEFESRLNKEKKGLH